MAHIAHLKDLLDKGVISATDFMNISLQAAQEKEGVEEQQPQTTPRMEPGRDGQTPPPSDFTTGSAESSMGGMADEGEDGFGFVRKKGFFTAEEADGGPDDYAFGDKVKLTMPDGRVLESTVERMGSAGDFLHKGKVRVFYQETKVGCKNKQVTIYRWATLKEVEMLARASAADPLDADAASAAAMETEHAECEEAVQREMGDMPEMARHERHRSLPQSREAPVRGRQSAIRKTEESKVSIAQRIANNPDETFTNSAGVLFCMACKGAVFNKASSIIQHKTSKMHKERKAKWNERGEDDSRLKVWLRNYYDGHPDEAMGNLPGDEMLYRFRVVEASMAAGIPLAKLDLMRPLLERGGMALTQHSHLKAYVPKVECRELERLKEELADQAVTVIFDGTTRIGEAISMTVRYLTADFKLHTRLVLFSTTLKHLDAQSLANLIAQVLVSGRGLVFANVVGFCRDSAAVNGAAVRKLTNLFSFAENLLCICHTVCLMGQHLELPTIAEFLAPWVGLIYSHSAAKQLWKDMLEKQIVGFSPIRWYCTGEIMLELHNNFSKLNKMLDKLDEKYYGDALRRQLRAVFSGKKELLELELAAMADIKVLITTTYEMEGDRLEVMLVYQRIEHLRSIGRTLGAPGTLPTLDNLLRKKAALNIGMFFDRIWPGMGIFRGKIIDNGVDMISTLPDTAGEPVLGVRVKYVADNFEEDMEPEGIRPLLDVTGDPRRKEIVKKLGEGFEYLEQRLTGNCQALYNCEHSYKVFRLVRIFDPSFADESQLSASDVSELAAVVPLGNTAGLLVGLQTELPKYMTKAKDSTFNNSDVAIYSEQLLQWWKNHACALPNRSAAARIVFSLTPNSASCERVFSLLKAMFGNEQHSSLADMLQASLMLKYNKRTIG